MPLVPLLCRTGSSLQLCCYYDYYDASAINGGGEEMVLARGTYLCIMAVMAWRVPSPVHAKEISFTFYDELVIMP